MPQMSADSLGVQVLNHSQLDSELDTPDTQLNHVMIVEAA